jgi:putative oxidoreductase
LIFLHLSTAGPGRYSLDSIVSSKNRLGNLLGNLTPTTLAMLRIGCGFLFWQYGALKFGLLGGRRVAFFQLRWLAGILEFFGAPLLLLGLFTRALAFLFSGEMAVAYWTSHFPRGQGFWPIQNGGEPAVLFCFIFLYLAAAGPGLFSLDRILFPRSR